MKPEVNIPTIDVKRYGGKQVAIVDGEIIAEGTTSREVIEKAREQVPSRPLRDIKVLAVPRTLDVIYDA